MNSAASLPKTSAWSLIPKEFSLLYFLLALMFVVTPFLRPLLRPENPLSFLGFIPFNMYIAIMATSSAKQILSLPFSYTLPRCASMIRKHLISIAVSANLLFLLPALLFPASSLAEKIQALSAIFLAGLALHIFFSWLILQISDTNALIGIATIGFVLMFQESSEQVLTLAGFIPTHPLLWLWVTGLALYIFNRPFKDPDFFRNLVEKPVLGFIDSLRPDLVRAFHGELALQKPGTNAVYLPAWFVQWNEGLQHQWASSYFCFYQQMALLVRIVFSRISMKKAGYFLAGYIPVMLVLIVLNSQEYYLAIMVFAILFSTMNMNRFNLDTYSLPYSRKGRALAAFLLAVLYNLFSIMFGLVIVMTAWLQDWLNPNLEPRLPLIGLLGFNCLFVPWFLIALTCLRNFQNGTKFFVLTIFMVTISALSAGFLDDYLSASIPVLLLLHLSGWLAFIPVLRWRYLHIDLVADTNC